MNLRHVFCHNLMNNYFGYIYKITNMLNEKIYVGQKFKKIEESLDYYGSGRLIKKAIKKYGKENFKKDILEKAYSREELNELEIYFIWEQNCMIPKGYNITKGGNSSLGLKHSKKTKKLIGFASRNRSLETRKKFSDKMKNHPVSEETRKKISIANTGKKPTEESKMKNSLAHLGRKASNETKIKNSLANKNTKWINNGFINKKIKINILQKYLNDGWFLGRKNKKIKIKIKKERTYKKHTKEQKLKMSIIAKNKNFGKWMLGRNKKNNESIRIASEKKKVKQSQENIEKRKEGLKNYYKENNCWNKGKTKENCSSIKKISEKMLGRKHINNGIINKFVKEDELEKLIQEGWVFGSINN